MAGESRSQRLARELEHQGSSSQHADDIEFVELPFEYGGGYAMRKKQELEAPFIDPLLPGFLGGLIPKSAPAKVVTGALRGLRGYGRLGAEGLHRFVNSGSPLATAVQPLGVIKQKGGQWLTGSVEDALKGLKKEFVPQVELGASIDDPRLGLNQWIDKQLTRYIKNDMATPEDPVRALAEQGVLHYAPDYLSYDTFNAIAKKRHKAGVQEGPLSKTPLAKTWETLSDQAISVIPASKRVANAKSWDREVPDWLRKLAPETPTYSLGRSDGLGLGHLLDELSNSLNPNSGLPRHLLLDPKSLPRVSVPQAVERVHNINQWRAAQKAEADALRANNAATALFKEYPENNPKGLRWVELKAPENLTPEQQTYYDKLISVQTDPQVAMGAARKYGTNPLADQLKYEGDTMGHCVGGYCDDVLSGRSRIFSLRDAKGQPHVTIETAPQSYVASDLANFIGKEEVDRLIDSGMSLKQIATSIENFKPAERVIQIKGKGNARPADEYLPFVQDFVKSGQWSDVGDLHNTGLMRHPKTGEFFTADEYKALPDNYGADPLRKGYAEGGSVKNDNFDQWSDEDLHQFITTGAEPPLRQNQQGQYVDPVSEARRAAAAEELRQGDFGGAFQRGASSIPFGLARLAGAEGADDASRLLGEDLAEDRKTWKGSLGATLGNLLPAAAWPFARGLTLGSTLLNAGSGAAAEGLSGYGEGHSATQALTQDAPRGAAGVALTNVGAKVVGKGINAARGEWSDPEMKYLYDFAKSKGVDLRPGDVTRGLSRGFEGMHFGPVGQEGLKRQTEQLEKALFGDGNKLLQGFERAEQAVKEAGQALWAPVNQIASQGTTNVAPKSARVVIDDMLGKYPNMLGKIDNVQLRDKLLAIAEAKPGKLPGLSFAEVRELQQAVGPELAKMKLQALNGTITKDEASSMARLYGSLHEDLKRWGQHGSNQKAYQAYKEANEVYKRDFLPFENNELITKWRMDKYDGHNEALISDLLKPSSRTQQEQLLYYLSLADHDATGYVKMLQAADRAGSVLAKGVPEQSLPLGIATLISPKVVAARAAAGAASGHPVMTPLAGARSHLLPDTAYSRPISRAVRGGLGLSAQELLNSKE